MKNQADLRDERYYAVENASYRIGYIILAFGLLVLIVIRAIAFQESNWDLFALVILSSFAATIYQATYKTIHFSWKWIAYGVAAAVLAASLTLVLATLTR